MPASTLVMMFLFASAPEVAPAAGGQKSVLVLDPRAVGVSEGDAKVLGGAVADHLSKRRELKVFTLGDIKAMVDTETARQLMGCESDAACISRMHDAVSTDLVVSGSLGKVGRSFVLSLVLVDAARADPLSRASESIDQLSDAPALLGPMLARMFGFRDVAAKPTWKLPAGKRTSFAVLDLEATGVAKDTALNLTQVLSVEIKRIENVTVIGRDDLAAILSKERLAEMFGAECDTSCMADIGGALGVDKLVVGKVGKLADSYLVSLRLIDPAKVVVDNRVTESFEGREEELLRAVRQAGRALLGVDPKLAGSLAVSGTEKDAEVFVDNSPVGVLPMAPRSTLRSGRHSVRVSKDGFVDWQSEIYVDPGETTAVFAELEERPDKWYQKWWVWTVAGAVLAGGGVAIALAAQNDPSVGAGVIRTP